MDELAKPGDEATQQRARRTIALVLDLVLDPYRRDRALFASVYRFVRFGDGAPAGKCGSLVRSLRFAEAADRIAALRPRLETWCYDELALRVSERLRSEAHVWEWLRGECRKRSWPEPPATLSDESDSCDPATIGGAFVVPHLAELPADNCIRLGDLLADLGDVDGARLCYESHRNAALAGEMSANRTETSALHSLLKLCDRSIPSTVGNDRGLTRWFEVHRGSLVAHAVGADGPVELGTWDDAMTASFLEGGLPWAPEQWAVERKRLAAVEPCDLDGIRGHVAGSPRWRVFTDVSPDFAAQATLVLEAAFRQAQDGLGLPQPDESPVAARIYAHHRDYVNLTHDKSSGHWAPRLNAVLTFLDDPDRTDFETFRYPTLVHEATHAALDRCLRHSAPSWMHEGLACFIQRWDPTRSVALNEKTTHDWVRNRAGLEHVRDAGMLPRLAEMCRPGVDFYPDDSGPRTGANYAAAASFFVFLAGNDEHWRFVRNWLDETRRGGLPVLPGGADGEALQKGWRDFVDYECGRLAGAR